MVVPPPLQVPSLLVAAGLRSSVDVAAGKNLEGVPLHVRVVPGREVLHRRLLVLRSIRAVAGCGSCDRRPRAVWRRVRHQV